MEQGIEPAGGGEHPHHAGEVDHQVVHEHPARAPGADGDPPQAVATPPVRLELEPQPATAVGVERGPGGAVHHVAGDSLVDHVDRGPARPRQLHDQLPPAALEHPGRGFLHRDHDAGRPSLSRPPRQEQRGRQGHGDVGDLAGHDGEHRTGRRQDDVGPEPAVGGHHRVRRRATGPSRRLGGTRELPAPSGVHDQEGAGTRSITRRTTSSASVPRTQASSSRVIRWLSVGTARARMSSGPT